MKVSSKGQITIPKDIRVQLGITPGEKVKFEESKQGFILKRVPESAFPDEDLKADSPLTENTAEALKLTRGQLK